MSGKVDMDTTGDLEGDVDADCVQSWAMIEQLNQSDDSSISKSKPSVSTPKGESASAKQESKTPATAKSTDKKTTPNKGTAATKPLAVGSKKGSTISQTPKKPVEELSDIAGIFGDIDTEIEKNKSNAGTFEKKFAAASPKTSTPNTNPKRKNVTTNQTSLGVSESSSKSKDAKSTLPSTKKSDSIQEAEPSPVLADKKDAQKDDSNEKMETSPVATESPSQTLASPGDGKSEVLTISEKDEQDVDARIAMQTFKGIMNCLSHKSLGDKIIVSFSPIEIEDLADRSVQKLIQTYTTLSFFFKKQTSQFKKKKGSAQAILFKKENVKNLLIDFAQLNLVEKQINVKIHGVFTKFQNFTETFTMNLNKSKAFMQQVRRMQAPSFPKIKKGQGKVRLDVEKIPDWVNFLTFKFMFPLCGYTNFQGKETLVGVDGEKASFHKVAAVEFYDKAMLDATLDCFSDFTFNDQPLKWKMVELTPDPKAEKSAGVKKETEDKEQADMEEAIGESLVDKFSDQNVEEQEEAVNEPDSMEEDTDDGVANMTRDVCSTMMESLNKLKQLENDDPNVRKILEMQAELMKLQESLTKNTDAESEKKDSKKTNKATSAIVNKVSSSESRKEQPLSGNETLSSSEAPQTASLNVSTKSSKAPEKLTEEEQFEKLLEQKYESEKSQAEKLESMKEGMRVEFERQKSQWAKRLLVEAKATAANKANTKATKQGKTGASTDENVKIEEKDPAQVKEEEEKLRREQELRAQQQLREELERADAAQKQATSSPGQWDPKALLQTVQESFQSLSETLPDGPERRASQEENSGEGSPGQPLKRRLSAATSESDDKGSKQVKQEVVLKESQYKQKYGKLPADQLPDHVTAQIAFTKGRRCPVRSCPVNKTFITAESFKEHWTTFHNPTTTLRFCVQCNAYFKQIVELESHLKKLHEVTDAGQLEKLVSEARVKVTGNPSYQNPWPFTYI